MASLTIRVLLRDEDFSKMEGYSVRFSAHKGKETEEQFLYGTRIFREKGGQQYFDLPNFEAKVANLLKPFVESYSVHANWTLTGKAMIVGRYEAPAGVSARATLDVDKGKYTLEAQGKQLLVLESIYDSFREGEPSLALVQRWDGKKVQSISESETRIAELETRIAELESRLAFEKGRADAADEVYVQEARALAILREYGSIITEIKVLLARPWSPIFSRIKAIRSALEKHSRRISIVSEVRR